MTTIVQTEEVTRAELLELKAAEEAYAKASKALTEAENAVKPLRLALAEKVLGIKTADELKAMAPETVAARMVKRSRIGLWAKNSNAPRFEFVKTSQGRYPSWRAEFIAIRGEVAAENITRLTPTIYGYKVDVL